MGLWAETVQQDVRGTLLTIVGLIVLLPCRRHRYFNHNCEQNDSSPIRTEVNSRRYKSGQLDTPVSFQSNDEIGELARSLERMRASLKAAMVRLNKT